MTSQILLTQQSPEPVINLSQIPLTDSGTLIVEFTSTIDGPLLSLSGEHGQIEIAISAGRIDGHIQLHEQHRHLDAEDARGMDNGFSHTLALTSNESGFHVYVDGYETFSATLSAWTSQLAATTLALDPSRIMTIHSVTLYQTPLTAAHVVAAAPQAAPFLEFAAAQLSDRDAKRCSALRQGSLRARFRARGRGQGGTLIAAQGTNGELALGCQPDGLFYRVTQNGQVIAEVTAPGSWDDGNWHDLVLVSGQGALVLYIDGYQVALAPGEIFFHDLGTITRVTVGMNLDQVRFFGEAQTAFIYEQALSDHQVKRLAGVSPLDTRALFDTGYAHSKSYRIPSLITLQSGVIIAGADQRVSIANDSPNDINFVIRRSLDGGETWEDIQTLITYPGSGALGASVIDSVIVQDEKTGKVIVLIDHFPGGIGQLNARVGVGYDEQGRMLLIAAKDQTETPAYYVEDGQVFELDGTATEYTVAANGDVFCSGSPAGNIYLAQGVDPQESLLTVRTSYIQMITSDDDGATWSDPVDLTATLKEPWMRFFGTSPGNGIQLKNGPHAGRLLMPAYYNHEELITFSCCAVFSDDGGATWQKGKSPNDGRELFGQTLSSRAITDDRGSLHESVLVEGKDGAVHCYMRNQHPSGRVGHAVSHDGGETWSDVDYVDQLTEIFSQPNAINVTLPDGRTGTVFANASQMLPFRGCGVLRLSFDDGKTWPHNRVLNPRHHVYQCLAQLPNDDLAVLWERETQGVYLTKLPLNWLTASQQTNSPAQ